MIKVVDARKLAIEELGKELVSIKPIKHTVKCAERSGSPIEIIETEQYYIDFGLGGNGKVNAEQFKTDLLAIVDKIEFKPAHLKNRLTDWIKGLNQDWCISRDRFSGVPIPNSDQVFDTWFTSSLTPKLATNNKGLFPFDLRPQAHEIIRTWAFYTIVKSYLHDNTIPWTTVMLSGWCLAADKTKMSKSKGNIVTPMPLIEEKGADVVRYWASCSHLGVDTHYNETKFVDGKKLINKLKNVAKFIAPHKQKIDLTAITESTDKWVIAKLNETIEQATKLFQEYNYCAAREVTEKFFWNIFCDNYLEIIKGRIYGEQGYAYKYDKFKNENIEKLQKSAATTTLVILSEILKLFSPIIPFTSEEIWSELFDEENSIHKIANFAKTIDIQTKTTELGDYMLDIIEKVRKYKAEKQLSIRAEIKQLSLPKLPKEIELDLLSVINAFDAEIGVGEFDIEC
jgi:valyl-tRNA synthetase